MYETFVKVMDVLHVTSFLSLENLLTTVAVFGCDVRDLCLLPRIREFCVDSTSHGTERFDWCSLRNSCPHTVRLKRLTLVRLITRSQVVSMVSYLVLARKGERTKLNLRLYFGGLDIIRT